MKEELVKGVESRHFIGRLLLLIKDGSKPPSIGNLRPITVSSNIIKIFEINNLRRYGKRRIVEVFLTVLVVGRSIKGSRRIIGV